MSVRQLILSLLLIAPALPASAAPKVSFVPREIMIGNRHWDVFVTPDVASFVSGSSLAVELDFEFSPGVASATLNDSFWSVSGTNPGNNPFTGTETEGLVVDAVHDTLFVAAGSELYATAAPMRLMTVETIGPRASFSMGDRAVLPGTAQAYTSSRIAQNGVNYDGLVLIGEMGPNCFEGDFNCDGRGGNPDLTLLLDNWGKPVPPTPAGWIGIPPTAPAVGNDELTLLLDSWGELLGGPETAAVPEPAALLAAASLFIGLSLFHRRRS